MLGMFTNFSLRGLKAAVRGSPKNGSYCSVPPRTNGLPSGKTTMPLQNMSQAIGKVLIVSFLGSQTAACRTWLSGSLPEPETTSTLPVCIRAACTGLMGISTGSVSHLPFWLGLASTTARTLVLACVSDIDMVVCFSCALAVPGAAASRINAHEAQARVCAHRANALVQARTDGMDGTACGPRDGMTFMI